MSIKIYIVGNTGSGKTALLVFFAKYFRELYPNWEIWNNLNLNISNSKYTEFGYLPSSEFLKGNKLICFDDIINLGNLKAYQEFLAVISRKTNTSIIMTCQYYTDIEKKLRRLCHGEIHPKLTHLKFDKITHSYRLTEKSTLIYDVYNPETLEYKGTHSISKILSIIQNAYNTNEIPKRPSERIIKEEILKYSKNLDDLEFNISVYTNNTTKQRRLLKQLCEIKGF